MRASEPNRHLSKYQWILDGIGPKTHVIECPAQHSQHKNAQQHTQTQTSYFTTMTHVGFEPTPLRTGALSQRLRPLGQSILEDVSIAITKYLPIQTATYC